MPTNKLKSFTILELIVVMILTGLLVGIGYMIINIYILQDLRAKKSFNYWESYITFKRVFRRDLFDAALLEKRDDRTLICNPGIAYEFNDSCIVRKLENGMTDTFYLHYQHLNWMILETSSHPLIKGIELDILFGNESIPFSVFKHYSSSDLFYVEITN